MLSSSGRWSGDAEMHLTPRLVMLSVAARFMALTVVLLTEVSSTLAGNAVPRSVGRTALLFDVLLMT